MHFASDNTGPVHPLVMEALVACNEGYAMPYGSDPWTTQATARIRDLFEAPDAAVHLVTLGTAANCLALACMTQPFETLFCTDIAHVQEDECNAPEHFTGGAKLSLVPSQDAKMSPAALRAAIEAQENRGVHGPQRGPVTITQATELGTVYSLPELHALTDTARNFGLSTYMDGARFSNALAHLGCTPADMSWRAGVDMVSFGGTKNGLMGVEAIVMFDPAQSWELELRRKRAAHLMSKHRFLSAQMLAYLTEDLWLDMARQANAACARLLEGLRAHPLVELVAEPQANIIFARFPRHLHQKLQNAHAQYLIMDGALDGDPETILTGRFVCDWSASDEDTDAFLALLAAN